LSPLGLEVKPIHWFITQDGSRRLQTNAARKAQGSFIFWLDGEVKCLTLRMMVSDELKQVAQRFFSIASPLIATVNKEVKEPR
jgi:hypothetical protein